jgi:hypothetical protein
MKAEKITVGATYSDQRSGYRRVLKIGSNVPTSGMLEDAIGVRYEVLMANSLAAIGTVGTMELKSFANWAKLEVPAENVAAQLIKLKAQKIATKLTEPQRTFLLDFDSDLNEGDSAECSRKEFRLAVACRQKGLITEMPDRLEDGKKYFFVRFSPVGLAVLAIVLGAKGA